MVRTAKFYQRLSLTFAHLIYHPSISNCFTPTLPSCSTTRSMRKIGYYAGFGDRRSCGTNITPDQVDWTGFTGAHFAFATITQDLQIRKSVVCLCSVRLLMKTNYSIYQNWMTPTFRYCRPLSHRKRTTPVCRLSSRLEGGTSRE